MQLGWYRKLIRTGYEWHHQVLTNADDVNLIDDGIRTIEINADVL